MYKCILVYFFKILIVLKCMNVLSISTYFELDVSDVEILRRFKTY